MPISIEVFWNDFWVKSGALRIKMEDFPNRRWSTQWFWFRENSFSNRYKKNLMWRSSFEGVMRSFNRIRSLYLRIVHCPVKIAPWIFIANNSVTFEIYYCAIDLKKKKWCAIKNGTNFIHCMVKIWFNLLHQMCLYSLANGQTIKLQSFPATESHCLRCNWEFV